jgi:hypothetical protein
MTAIARRSIRTLVALGVCVITPALFVSFHTSTAASAAGSSSCEVLHEWAKAYTGTSPTIETLAPFDRAHRIAIFNAITPAVRSALWQEQLRRLARRSEFSDAQRQLIVEAIDLSTPAMYAKEPAARRAADEYWTRAKHAFPTRESRLLLFELGGPSASTRARANRAVPSVWDRLTGPFRAQAQPIPWCECSQVWQDCYFCVSQLCRYQMDGCGPYSWFECDGRCDYWEWPPS